MKQLSTLLKFSCIAVSVSWLATDTQGQNIVQDGSFELSPPALYQPNPPFPPAYGPFTPGIWTAVDTSGPAPVPAPGFPGSNTNVSHDALFAKSGNNYASLGSYQQNGSLTQQLVTVPGTRYTLSFFLANDGLGSTATPNFFQVTFGGTTVLTLSNVSVFGYTGFTFTNLLASGALTTLQFIDRNDDDSFRLDAVYAAVPESGYTGFLALLTLPGLLLLNSKLRGRARNTQS